jgi:hypothetical protein
MATPTDPAPIGVTLARSALGQATQRWNDEKALPNEPEPAATPLDGELDAWLAADMLDDTGDYRAPETDAHADQLLGVAAHLQGQIDAVNETVKARVERLRAFQEERVLALDAELTRVEALLSGYTRALFEQSGQKVRTWKLPNGQLQARAQRTKVHVLDDEKVADWLEADPAAGAELVATKTTRSIVKAAVSKLAKEGRGEPVAGGVAGAEPDYTPHHIKDATGRNLPGIYLLVPDEPDAFKAVPS